MTNYKIRYNPLISDVIRIKEILRESTFFNDEEVNIGVSLIKESLNEIRNSGYKFVFLETEDGVVGYTCYGFIDGTKSSYNLYWIAVDQNYKRSGYGSILLKLSEEAIKNLEGKNIYIETSSTKKYLPTREFYLKAGYISIAEIKDFYDEGDNKVIYCKTV